MGLGTVLGVFARVLRRAVLSPVPVAVWVGATVIFAVSGPFGTYDQFAFFARLTLWTVIIGLTVILAVGLRVAIQVFSSAIEYLPAALSAALLTGGVIALALPASIAWAFAASPGTIPNPVDVFITTSMICACVALARAYFAPPSEAQAEQRRPRLLSRLPAEIEGDILHVSVSDHYVEVATDRGSARVLMRFADALDEIGQMDGLRVHRSHWVARAAISKVERENGRTFLTLRNGMRVPVSRAHLNKVDGLG